MAIKEWVKLKDGQAVPLERALAAFDLFVLHRRKGDFDEVRSKDLTTHTQYLADKI